MIRAAICDDEPTILDYLHEHISNEFKRQGAEIQIDKFTSGNDFLTAHKAEPFDVVFLDIDMPVINGFDVAEKISGGEHILIIFVTTHDELVFSSLKFQPFRFMRKTHINSEIEETVGAVNNKLLKRKTEQRIKFQTKDNEIYVSASDIEYIEVYGHWLRVYLNKDETVECYGSLSELEKQLVPLGFVRTYKSYLVNFKYIHSISKAQVTLDNGTEIPLSRYKANEVRDKFKDYLRSEL